MTIILIAGGSCSGKSVFAKWFKNSLLIDLDRFYLPLPQIPKDSQGELNFDTPEALDIAACANAVIALSKGKEAKIPLYSYLKNDRVGEEIVRPKKSTQFILVEGLYALYPPLRKLADMKIFLDTPSEIRVARRILRDITRKKRTKAEILANFVAAEKGYQTFVYPTKKYANLVIPFSANPIKITR